jgi:hypothetical protein
MIGPLPRPTGCAFASPLLRGGAWQPLVGAPAESRLLRTLSPLRRGAAVLPLFGACFGRSRRPRVRQTP